MHENTQQLMSAGALRSVEGLPMAFWLMEHGEPLAGACSQPHGSWPAWCIKMLVS